MIEGYDYDLPGSRRDGGRNIGFEGFRYQNQKTDGPINTVEQKPKTQSTLLICNHCGRRSKKAQKQILEGQANILCPACSKQMDDEIGMIAKKYLSERS